MSPIIEVEDMYFRYRSGEDWILKGINMSIEEGSIVTILGMNGSGKTTLLKILSGILIPQRGRVKICDVELSKRTAGKVREIVGLVLQDPDTHLLMPTVREELSIPLISRGFREEEVYRRVEYISKLVGIQDILDKSVDELSFGQKKRVSIASILIAEPKILLLDEPTLGLDPITCISLMDLVVDIAKRKRMTVIFSTQDLDIAALYAEYVYVMRDGKIVASGSRDDVLRNFELMRNVCGLRLTRIGHLFEIASKRGLVKIDRIPLTISEALKVLERNQLGDY